MSEHDRKRPASLETYRPGLNVTPEEIRQILADGGYSAGARSGWLKTLLTDITSENSDVSDPNRAKLVEMIKEILDESQDGRTIADDTL